MNKKLITLAVASTLLAPAAFAQTAAPAAAEPAAAPASPLSFNVGVTSNYLFRGITQTHGGPAMSAGVDYAHESGFYVGAWGSSVTWVRDFLGKGTTEIDVYGGYKNTFADPDWNYDLGIITYNYPGKGQANPTNLANPNTSEVYGAIGYKWLTAKYSHTISKNFIGWYGGPNLDQNTRGSNYLELNGVYDLGDGWGLTGHIGRQKVKNSVTASAALSSLAPANYQDWKFGVTKDVGFAVLSLEYSGTRTNGSCNKGGTAAPTNGSSYCWGVGGTGGIAGGFSPNRDYMNAGESTIVFSAKATF